MENNLKKIQTHEWHLWYLTLSLLLILGSLIVVTYLILIGDALEEFGIAQSSAKKGLWGLGILILLFCAYVIQTRFTLGKMQKIIQRQATHDDLTNLYNRTFFDQQMEYELVRAQREQYNISCLLCDIDGFKSINDSRGHHKGDMFLKEVARTIQESTRGSDLVFRWGADEFMVVLLRTTREGILIAAERFREGMKKISYQNKLNTDLSIGAALFPEQAKNIDQLINLAHRALFIAKKSGDKIQIGDEKYHLDEQSVKIVFQPIIDVWSDKTLGYEALGRDPQGKLNILDLFKKHQAIGKLTELKCICFRKTLKLSQELGLERVFINIDFKMLNQLESIPKPPDMDVILEISEAEVLHNIDIHLDNLNHWRKMGYRFAIDDFGAGFISLPFIAQFKPDYIKLDRSTILQAVASIQFREFLKKLISALRMYSSEGIIAEGIEIEKELEVVKDLGIYIIQGFLLGKPQDLKNETQKR